MTTRSSQTQDKFIVRLPDGMRDRISGAAKANGRTMTAEIVARLKWSFDATSGFSTHELETEARSEQAAKRLMRIGLIEPDADRLDAIEARLADHEARVAALERKVG
ncbi:Arc family DNA-binding protein [Aurantimonas sp. VKM B-3413]|uniref:Arc family DNA-binding protein n=1 Tax=Aurantimonas sp. VKM B-3413 TaxID=2779401 RepID=UPI001E5F894D|nr:Arc family DNA-binding protein [Aurantimonas sp. VKM B-3413]MCB8836911.1 Arc family DNA-binding protein [Aurantimonas sp. VKM B-3413]